MADNIGEQLDRVLTIYSSEINAKLQEITRESMQRLVRETKATAPRGKRNGQFRRKISGDYSALNQPAGSSRGRKTSATWYVKAPDYRLTHLIVHGHAKRDGGRTRPNPFLQNALDRVLPEYEQKVQEALRSDQ